MLEEICDCHRLAACIGRGRAVDHILDIGRKETVQGRDIFANDRVEIGRDQF